MADQKASEKATTPLKQSSPAPEAESPTTARELEFDDGPQETGVIGGKEGESGARVSSTENPPPKPPRPMSPQQQAEATLKEAFPSVDSSVIKAVLVASAGKIEPAFNALLSMTDPDARAEPTPPPQPPRPSKTARFTSTGQSQIEADEQYARQLAEHYGHPGYGSRGWGDPPLPRRHQDSGLKPNELYDDKEHSFIDDDLPVIRENIRKGFFETQTRVNKWVSDFRRKLDGETEEEINKQSNAPTGPAKGYNPGPPQQPYGYRQPGEIGRRSGDRDRYDADPAVLSDDFTALEMRDDEAVSPPPRRSSRPLANPDLFKSTAQPPQSGPVDEVDAAARAPISAPSTGRRASASGVASAPAKQSKWQPLTSIDPAPITDNDPFSLGDSEDERESKTKDVRAEASERLKKAAAESKATEGSEQQDASQHRKSLEPHARSGSLGTKDQVAEEKLTGGS
ncbi:hypothetical protein L228DRAFT_265977 [Xylona heveae TC161]|uniref:CUE domain-containing protein n=1 Tax=Xylona heveae (strain CBS 132557 / TC161) TaxID=1328760 RepID=A0A165IXJ3_XYLHT|nr:hypothetical protein L228DRAFT_265977 [Xylona heveae TC161]KZF25510.1 hypothetical protein L228DRAFT_265977 [Xylona heveae TC161]